MLITKYKHYVLKSLHKGDRQQVRLLRLRFWLGLMGLLFLGHNFIVAAVSGIYQLVTTLSFDPRFVFYCLRGALPDWPPAVLFGRVETLMFTPYYLMMLSVSAFAVLRYVCPSIFHRKKISVFMSGSAIGLTVFIIIFRSSLIPLAASVLTTVGFISRFLLFWWVILWLYNCYYLARYFISRRFRQRLKKVDENNFYKLNVWGYVLSVILYCNIITSVYFPWQRMYIF